MKKIAVYFSALVLLGATFSISAFGSLLRCETGNDAGVKASGIFYLTGKCRSGYALQNPKSGKLNCLYVSRDFSSYNGMAVDICVVDTGNGLLIVDMRPQGAE